MIENKNRILQEEKAVLVGLVYKEQTEAQLKEYLDELVLLADTAGADVRHKITQERTRISPSTFIGSGKAKEVGQMVADEKIGCVWVPAAIALASMSSGVRFCAAPRNVFMVRSPSGVTRI